MHSGQKFYGVLSIEHNAAQLSIWSEEPISLEEFKFPVQGRTERGTEITLLDFVVPQWRYPAPMKEFAVEPRKILRGNNCFDPTRHKVTKIQFGLSDSQTIFPIHLRQVPPKNRREILRAIIGESYSPDDPGRSFDRVYYCSGPTELFVCDAENSRISARVKEVITPSRIDVEIVIEIKEGDSLSGAIYLMLKVSNFFGLIIGNHQEVKNIKIETSSKYCFDNRYDLRYISPTTTRSVYSRGSLPDFLIDPMNNTDEFVSVLYKWMKISDKRTWAYSRVLSKWEIESRPVDRLTELLSAFEWWEKEGEDTSSEDYVIPGLDRIKEHLPEDIQKDILGVVSCARNLRNILVHENFISQDTSLGPFKEASEDACCTKKSKKNARAFFCIQTLEFIFLAYILTECDWKMGDWVRRDDRHLAGLHPFEHSFARPIDKSIVRFHPFDHYIFTYRERRDQCM